MLSQFPILCWIHLLWQFHDQNSLTINTGFWIGLGQTKSPRQTQPRDRLVASRNMFWLYPVGWTVDGVVYYMTYMSETEGLTCQHSEKQFCFFGIYLHALSVAIFLHSKIKYFIRWEYIFISNWRYLNNGTSNHSNIAYKIIATLGAMFIYSKTGIFSQSEWVHVTHIYCNDDWLLWVCENLNARQITCHKSPFLISCQWPDQIGKSSD